MKTWYITHKVYDIHLSARIAQKRENSYSHFGPCARLYTILIKKYYSKVTSG